ncbi:spike base protein, RCAP_Rcc01079 family [Rhodobacter capsulatus]
MDVFAKHAVSLESPAVRHYEITPSDSTDLARRPRALRVQTGGGRLCCATRPASP